MIETRKQHTCDYFLRRRVGCARNFDDFIAYYRVAVINSGIVSVEMLNLERTRDRVVRSCDRCGASVFRHCALLPRDRSTRIHVNISDVYKLMIPKTVKPSKSMPVPRWTKGNIYKHLNELN